ncbi:hypothetical protein [Legionella rubrilucens]|uniref:hypothetical protein n=1 Tax=Legionella rubrilucens TaxID=458 RepID=UPI000730AE81|nr:hypothetical protein [Legionella rubrilucens]
MHNALEFVNIFWQISKQKSWFFSLLAKQKNQGNDLTARTDGWIQGKMRKSCVKESNSPLSGI